jgi:hypothetical protein
MATLGAIKRCGMSFWRLYVDFAMAYWCATLAAYVNYVLAY